MARVAALVYEPSSLAATLQAHGFAAATLFTPHDANHTYFAGRLDGLRVSGAHLMSAIV